MVDNDPIVLSDQLTYLQTILEICCYYTISTLQVNHPVIS